ncbi:serine/threonine kinase [Aureococcus anophagefferens]|nr:serine/threonine kinase [Aureococcus anophagefferens]
MVRLTQVSSPHCVRLRQYATVAEPLILWALTDLCEGGALSERLKRRPPPAAARLERWWRDATAGLAAIHKLRVAHRDVKTENIFLTSCGTPAFLAPEILSNQPYTLKADVWSLGCVFFETVAGRPLNAMAHDDDTIVAQFREAAAARGLPGLFPRVFERILRRDPDDRPSSSDAPRLRRRRNAAAGQVGLRARRVAPAPAQAPRVVEQAEAARAAPGARARGAEAAAVARGRAPASFLKEALDDAEPPRDAAADERKARQRAAEDAKAIAELERGAASVRDFHRARTADRRRPSAREPRFQQSQTSPRLP